MVAHTIVWNETVARGLERSPVYVLHGPLKVPATSRHRQPGIELHFSHRGRGSYHVESELYVLSGCDLVVTPGSFAHQVFGNLRTRFTRTVVCVTDVMPQWLASAPEFAPLSQVLRAPAPVKLYFSPSDWEEIEEQLRRLDREHQGRQRGWQGAMIAHVIHLLVLIQRCATPAAPPSDHYIAQCLKVIEANLSEELLLTDLAREVAVSPKHLSREFRSTVGMPLAHYIWRRRVAKAKELLKGRPDLEIQEVARRCGFKTASHFTRKFAEIAGTTPLRFRESALPERAYSALRRRRHEQHPFV